MGNVARKDSLYTSTKRVNPMCSAARAEYVRNPVLLLVLSARFNHLDSHMVLVTGSYVKYPGEIIGRFLFINNGYVF